MTKNRELHLIIGKDSFLGSEYCRYLLSLNISHIGTSRRKMDSSIPDILFLDLEEWNDFEIPPLISRVEIFAGITGYEECAYNMESYHVNVTAVSEIAKKAIDRGIPVSYVSSSSVFSKEVLMASESDAPRPDSEYGNQKYEAELAILKHAESLGRSDLVSIVRPTKILSQKRNPIRKWLSNSSVLLPNLILSDLYFSPISSTYFCSALLKIANSNMFGIFHLSGSQPMSYSDFAKAAVRQGIIKDDLLTDIKMADLEVPLFYAHKTGYLNMERTMSLLGISPQKLEEVLEDLF